MKQPRRTTRIQVTIATCGEVMDRMEAAGVEITPETWLMAVEWLTQCAAAGAVLALAGLGPYFDGLKAGETNQ